MKKNQTFLSFFLLAAYGIAQKESPQPKLQYAVILTRHGVRAPLAPNRWLHFYSVGSWPSWGVLPGHLTPHGRQMMKLMGAYYGETFRAEGLLARNGCEDSGRIYVWSDSDQRTTESARALLEGIIPGCRYAVHSGRPGIPDPLLSTQGTARFRSEDRSGLQPALDKLHFVLKGARARSNLSLRTAATLAENLMLEYANGFEGNELGWGRLSQEDLQEILTLRAAQPRKAEYARNLWLRIQTSLCQAATGESIDGSIGPKNTALLILSGHDKNLESLAALLGLNWQLASYPKNYASPGGALVFTLWRQDGRFRLRSQYIAQSLEQLHNGSGGTPVVIDLGSSDFTPITRPPHGHFCVATSLLVTSSKRRR